MIEFSTEPDEVHPASCAQALVEAFVAALRSRLAPERVTFTVDYASLVDTPHPASGSALRQHVVALAAALAAHVDERSAAVMQLSFSGVRTSGSVHLEATVEHAELLAEGLAAEVAAEGGALLQCEPHRAVIAFYPQMIAAERESISSHR